MGSRLFRLVALVYRDLKGRRGTTSADKGVEGKWASPVLLAGLIVLGLAAVGLTAKILLEIAGGVPLRRAFLPGTSSLFKELVNSTPEAFFWFLLVAASAAVRRVLIQYVGDVAIYISPYKLRCI